MHMYTDSTHPGNCVWGCHECFRVAVEAFPNRALLADKFEVTISTVKRWGQGVAPHPAVRALVLDFIRLYRQKEAGMKIVIYRSTNREGATFALTPGSRRELEAYLKVPLRLTRVFVAHAQEAERDTLYMQVAHPIIALLAPAIDRNLVVFMDPETEQEIPLTFAPSE